MLQMQDSTLRALCWRWPDCWILVLVVVVLLLLPAVGLACSPLQALDQASGPSVGQPRPGMQPWAMPAAAVARPCMLLLCVCWQRARSGGVQQLQGLVEG